MAKSPIIFGQERPGRAERRAQGKKVRDACSRASHARATEVGGAKRDPVELIEGSNKDRWQHLVPVRHGRMMESAFAFFRGTALLQAHDLAQMPSSGIEVQACGDCHLMNFGGFATPERALTFDINDFDETFPAPFEWDLKRLATSVMLAGRWRGFDAKDCRDAAEQAVFAYQKRMLKKADAMTLDLWYDQLSVDDIAEEAGDDEDILTRVAAASKRAQDRNSAQVFEKLAIAKGDTARLLDQPPLLYHLSDHRSEEEANAQIRSAMQSYRVTLSGDRQALFDRWRLVDIAVKVVGVGSVGTRCFVGLFMADDDDPLFLQFKEARPSVLEGLAGPPRYEHNGERIVVGQRLMQAASDIFLGWTSVAEGRDFFVRQLRDMKVSPRLETFKPRHLAFYARMCGLALARAHAKAGDPAMIAGYIGKGDAFGDALADHAVHYANQVERDYALFRRAVRDGRLASDTTETPVSSMLR
ncbi:MAG: DUF2252 domain-containing protein [Rhodospirillales bacterium]|nr:MAG: DUF2252 domain-containing protein [Rhodospirillales bacterium]